MGNALGRARAFILDRIRRRPVVFTDSRGLRYVLYPGENARVYFAHGGNYEVAETRLCEHLLREGDIAIDGGANIGLYSLLFGRLVGDTGRVIAFEPDPVNAKRLAGNLVLNRLEWIEVEETALWSKPGRMTLHRFELAFGPWHSLGSPELPHPFRRGEIARPVDAVEVGVTSLDAYCESAGVDKVSLLKLDIEGAEPDALTGAARLLERHAIDVVLFEVSLPQSEALGHQPSDAFEILHRYGYKAHAIHSDGAVGAPVAGSIGRYRNYVALPPGSPHAPLA